MYLFTKHNTRGSFNVGHHSFSFALSEISRVTFGKKWIGRGDSWPAGSPDLNLLDFLVIGTSEYILCSELINDLSGIKPASGECLSGDSSETKSH